MAENPLTLADAPQAPEAPEAPDGTAEVHLVGGPTSIPRRVLVSLEEATYGKIKIPHLSGYEHFVRAADEAAPDLFSWVARTKIAE